MILKVIMKQRIIHTISAHDVFGPEKTIINESRELLQKGYDVLIVLIHPKGDFPLLARIKKENIPCFHLISDYKFDLPGLVRLMGLLIKTKCTLVHSHGYKADIISLITSRILKIPIITTIHGWTKEDFKVRLYEKIQAFFWRFFDLILCVSESYMHQALKLGIEKNKLILLHNGIVISDYQIDDSDKIKQSFINEHGIPKDNFIVGIIGRLSIEKGHKYFLEAACEVLQQNAHVSFVIIGDGIERNNIEHFIMNSPYKANFYVLGHVYDMKKAYAALDAVVIASLREGLPNVLLEAMACGKPIVATKVGGIPEVVTNNQNGFLVPPEDSMGLANAMAALIQDQNTRERFVAEAKRTILARFSFEHRMKRITDIYSKYSRP